MSILDNLKKFVQPYSDDEYDDEYDEEMDDLEEEEVQEPAPRSRRVSPFATAADSDSYSSSATVSTAAASSSGFSGQVLNMGVGGKQEVVLFHTKSFDSAAKAADELGRKKAVILNMENVDKALTRRVVDFLSGAVYALNGSVKKIAQSTYLFCPHNMDVVGDLEHMAGDVENYI